MDAKYAPSHAALAGAYCSLATWGLSTPSAVFPKAKAEALKAIELDDSLVGAHTALSTVKWRFDWDFPGAEAEIRRAIGLNSNRSGVHWDYSYLLAVTGRLDDAVAEARKAYELDPISLESERELGWILYLARRYDESITRFRKALEIDQNRPVELAILAGAYARRGMTRDAGACSAKGRELVAAGKEQMLDAYLADPFCQIGKQSEVINWIGTWERVSTQGHVESFLMALMSAPTGNRDKAFGWLERAFEERSVNMPFLKVHPQLDSLHSDPRFQNLVLRVGFPDH